MLYIDHRWQVCARACTRFMLCLHMLDSTPSGLYEAESLTNICSQTRRVALTADAISMSWADGESVVDVVSEVSHPDFSLSA